MSHPLFALLERAGIPLYAALPYRENPPVIPCAAVRRIPADSRSIVVMLLPYRTAHGQKRELAHFACVPDYHHVAQALLSPLCQALEKAFPGEAFAWFADNSPFDERALAVRAGLGVSGQNGLVIHPQYGSWVFIAELVTTLPLPYTRTESGSCLQCGACVRACPGSALSVGRDGLTFFDEGRCISFLTQKKGPLNREEQSLLRKTGLIWGCDRCQEVCPMNRLAEPSSLAPFQQERIERLDPQKANSLCKRYAFGFRGKKVVLRNWAILHPNCIISSPNGNNESK